MRISVIIPVLNEEENLGKAAASAWKAGADEVIVVDGGSDDRTIEIARQHDSKVLSCDAGRAAQQNSGASQADGEVLLFLHADNWLADSCLEQVRDALKNDQRLAGAFHQKIAASGIGFRLLERGNAARVRLLGLPYGDQAIFIRRATFEELGGFPEVRLMEDLLLMKKLRRSVRPVLLPGPLHVSARRWQQNGVVRQTMRNWSLLTAYKLGCSPDRLARFYARHDA